MVFRDLDDLHTVTFGFARLKNCNLFVLLRMERLSDIGIEDYMIDIPCILDIPYSFGGVDETKIYLEASPVIHH